MANKHTFYEQDVLDHLHKTEMIILKDVDALCKKYGLTYFAFWGTGIGALRHGGFIPWDDDIDICLPRKDYHKLLKLVEKEYPGKYHPLNPVTSPNYPLATTRLCLNGTVFREHAMKNVDCDWGIFIDLYALDNVADCELKAKKQMWTAWFWGKLLILRNLPRPYLYIDGIIAKLVTGACILTYHGMKVLGISKRWLYKKRELNNRKYNNISTKRIGFFCDPRPDNNIFALEDVYPLRMEKFEDMTIPFPKELEKLLTIYYGDFMQLPPEEKRKTHYPDELDFGKY